MTEKPEYLSDPYYADLGGALLNRAEELLEEYRATLR